MQYLKEEVRNRIIEEALKEFKNLGYKAASIRNIAKNSNTSVGNMYKYFQSKEELFESIIGSVYERLMNYIGQFNRVELNDRAGYIFYELMDKILEIFNENSLELSILLNKSSGSRYENCKAYFVDFVTRIVTETMEYELSLKNKRLRDNFIIYLLSYSLVESIAIILDKREDGAEVRVLISNLIDIFFMDIEDKLSSEDM